MPKQLETYHLAWLSAHPERTQEWLSEILAQGFHVHHIDGDHHNDDPKNLVLIESGDHMMLHNGASRLLWKPNANREKKIRKQRIKEPLDTVAQAKEKLLAAEMREYIAIEKMRKAAWRLHNARLKENLKESEHVGN